MPRTARTADCHPDRKHYANGLCRACYNKQARKTSDANYEASEKAAARYDRYNKTEKGKQRKADWHRKYYRDKKAIRAHFGEQEDVVYAWLKRLAFEGLAIAQQAEVLALKRAKKTGPKIAAELGLD